MFAKFPKIDTLVEAFEFRLFFLKLSTCKDFCVNARVSCSVIFTIFSLFLM